MPDEFRFHHVGVAVSDMEQAMEFYMNGLGFQLVSGPFEDPIQKVKVCFLAETPGSVAHLELISPMTSDSPVNGYLSKGMGAYHVCYEVDEIDDVLAKLRAKRCLIISKPVPAVAFDGRRIAWCFTPTKQLIELVERNALPAGH